VLVRNRAHTRDRHPAKQITDPQIAERATIRRRMQGADLEHRPARKLHLDDMVIPNRCPVSCEDGDVQDLPVIDAENSISDLE
jgi:hypothetical protein